MQISAHDIITSVFAYTCFLSNIIVFIAPRRAEERERNYNSSIIYAAISYMQLSGSFALSTMKCVYVGMCAIQEIEL